MLRTTMAAVAVGLWIATASAAFAQVSAQAGAAKLPPDINPVSLSRLPPLTRADLDAEGQAAYDKIVGDGPAPRTARSP